MHPREEVPPPSFTQLSLASSSHFHCSALPSSLCFGWSAARRCSTGVRHGPLKQPVLFASLSDRIVYRVCAHTGEISYQFLSLFAKGLLGGILIANVLVYRSFDEAVAAAN